MESPDLLDSLPTEAKHALAVVPDQFRVDAVVARRGARLDVRCTDLGSRETLEIELHTAERPSGKKTRRAFNEQLKMLKGIESSVIRRVRGGFVDGQHFGLYCDPLADYVTLNTVLAENGGHITLDETAALLGPVIDALCELHEAGLSHRTLDPDDLLITASGPKIRGVGIGPSPRQPAKDEPHSYTAPEALFDHIFQPSGDVYSIGAIAYRCLTGRATGELFVEPSKAIPGLDPRLDDFIEHALHANPNERPSMRDVSARLFEIVTTPARVESAASEVVGAVARAAAGNATRRIGGLPPPPPGARGASVSAIEAETRRQRAEAETAKADADRMKNEIARALGEVETARREAQTARNEAETAREEARRAQRDAAAIHDAAVQEKTDAVAFMSRAEDAGAEAASEAAKAGEARAEAEAAIAQAVEARAQADAARADAEQARAEAERVRAEALEAKAQADEQLHAAAAAMAEAETVWKTADRAKSQAHAMGTQAADASDYAAKVKADADASRAEATWVNAEAQRAKSEAEALWAEAEEAKTEARRTTQQAKAAREEAATALGLAESARAEAEAAKADAAAARAEAERVKIEAEAARKDADAARADAERARIDANAISTTASSALADAEACREADAARRRAAAEEIIALTSKAAEQAESAGAQAASERARAAAAWVDAEASAASAAKAKEESDRAKRDADESKATAQRARAEADRFKLDAQREMAAARAERVEAERERSAAAAARNDAQEAIAAAQREAAEANEARIAAEAARVQAEATREEATLSTATAAATQREAEELTRAAAEAKTLAEAAIATAETERNRASILWTEAEASAAAAQKARIEAEAVRDEAKQIVEDAKRAVAEADETREEAARAKSKAEAALAKAVDRQTQVDNFEADAAAAIAEARRVVAEVEASRAGAAEARAAAAAASEEAEQSRRDANEARENALRVRTEAESEQALADLAREDARESKAEAEAELELAMEAKTIAAKATEVAAAKQAEAAAAEQEALQAIEATKTAMAEAQYAAEEAGKAREAAETARVDAEQARADADQVRDEALRAKGDAEAEWAGAEAERAAAREAIAEASAAVDAADARRARAEAESEALEQARLQAEQARIDAEGQRAAAEHAKAEAAEISALALEAGRQATSAIEAAQAQSEQAAAEWTEAEAATATAAKARADAEAEIERLEATRAEALAAIEAARTEARAAIEAAELAKTEAFAAREAAENDKSRSEAAMSDLEHARARVDEGMEAVTQLRAQAERETETANAERARAAAMWTEAEAAAASAGTARAEAEHLRAQAEADRIEAERSIEMSASAREEAAAAADAALTARREAEAAMAAALEAKGEADRIASEAAELRAQAERETAAANAERERAAAGWTEAEAAAASAITARAEADAARQEAEAARADAETTRAQAIEAVTLAQSAQAEAKTIREEALRSQAQSQEIMTLAASARTEADVQAARAAEESQRAAAAWVEAEAATARATEVLREAETTKADAQAAHADAAVARAEADAARAEADLLRQEAADAKAIAAEAIAAANAIKADADAAAAQAATAAEEAKVKWMEADTGRADAERARGEAEAARAEAEAAHAEARAAKADAEQVRSDAQAVREESERRVAEAAAAQRQAEEATAEAHAATSQAEAARADAARAKADAETARDESTRAKAEADEALARVEQMREEAEAAARDFANAKARAEADAAAIPSIVLPSDPENLVGWLHVLEQHPTNDDARRAVARIESDARDSNRWDRVANVLKGRIAHTEAQAERIDLLRQLARIYDAGLQQPGAAFETVVSLMGELSVPGQVSLVDDLARLATVAGRWPTAAEIIEPLAERAPEEEDRARLSMMMARAHANELGSLDRAHEMYRRVLKLKGNDPELLVEIGAFLRRADEPTALVDVLRRIADVTSPPARHQALVEAARVSVDELHTHEEALALLMEVRAENPDHAEANALAEPLAQSLGRNDLLIGLLEARARAAGEGQAIDQLREAAGLLDDANDPERSLAAWRAVFAADPNDVGALERIIERLRARVEAGDPPHELVEALLRRASRADAQERATLVTECAALLDRPDASPEDLDQVLGLRSEIVAALPANDPLAAASGEWLIQELSRREDHERVHSLLRMQTGEGDLDDFTLAEKWRQIFELVRVDGPLASARDEREALAALHRLDTLDAAERRRLLELLIAAGDPEPARLLLRDVVIEASDRDRVNLSLALARLYVDGGELKRASRLVKEMLAASPSAYEGWKVARDIHLASGKELEAAEAALLVAKTCDVDDERADAYFQAAQACHFLGRPARALERLEEAVEIDPDHAGATELLARSLVDAGELARALPHALRLADQLDASGAPRANRASASLVAARCSLGAGDDEQARDLLVRARELDGTNMEVVGMLADLDLAHGRFESALESYQATVLASADLPARERAELYAKIGDACVGIGEVEKGRRMVARAIELDPDYEPALRRSIELAEDDRERVMAQLGLLDMLGRLEDAASPEQRAEEVDLLRSSALVIARSLKRPKQASAMLARARELAPDDSTIQSDLVEVHRAAGEFDEAIDLLEAMAEDEADPVLTAEHFCNAATIALDDVKQPQVALGWVNFALESDPECAEAKRLRIPILAALGDWPALANAIEQRLADVDAAEVSTQERLQMIDALAELHTTHVPDIGRAYQEVQQARALALEISPDSDPAPRIRKAYDIALRMGEDGIDKAVAEGQALIAARPTDFEIYHQLLELFLESDRRDAAGCVARTLRFAKQADVSELELAGDAEYRAPRGVLTSVLWRNCLMHRWQRDTQADLFAAIWTEIAAGTGTTHADLDLDRSQRVREAFGGVPRKIADACMIFDVEPPELFIDSRGGADIAIHALVDDEQVHQTLLLGDAAATETDERSAAFRAGRAVARLVPASMLASNLPSPDALDNLARAAVLAVRPDFPLPDDKRKRAGSHASLLQQQLSAAALARLAEAARSVKSPISWHMHRWLAGVDFTATRAGFLLCDDLAISAKVLATNEANPHHPVGPPELIADLLSFSVSAEYLELRGELELESGT